MKNHSGRLLKQPSTIKEWLFLIYDILNAFIFGCFAVMLYFPNASLVRIPASLSLPAAITVVLFTAGYAYLALRLRSSSTAQYLFGLGFWCMFISVTFIKEHWLMAISALLYAIGFVVRAIGQRLVPVDLSLVE